MTLPPRRVTAAVIATLALVTAGLSLAGTSSASAAGTGAVLNGYESDLLTRTNSARAEAGEPALVAAPGLTDLARTWAATEVAQGRLAHNPDLANQLLDRGAGRWSVAAENVARGGSSSTVFATYLASRPHQENLLRTSTTDVGIGTARSADGTVYDVMIFTDAYDASYGVGRTTPEPIGSSGEAAAPTTTAVPTTTTARPVAPEETTTKPAPPTTAPRSTVAPTTVPRTTTPPRNTTPPAPRARVGAVTGLAGKCLDIRGAKSSNGTAVQLYRCNGSGAQRWTPTSTGTVTALGRCLDVSGGARSNGALVQLYRCNGTAAQRWVAGANGSLRNPGSGKCLDVPAARTTDGTQLVLWTCNAGANQRWNLPS